MTTARTLITAAMKEIQVLQSGEVPTADEAQDALATLNRMIGMWSAEGLMVWFDTVEALTLIIGTAEYTIGTGGTMSTTRPEDIKQAYIRVDSTDHPLEIISHGEYQSFPNKATSGRPAYLAFNPAYPLGKIHLYPTPDAAWSIYLVSHKPLTAWTALDTDVSLPAEYDGAIVANLAIALAPQYGASVRNDVAGAALWGRRLIKRRAATPVATVDLEVARMTQIGRTAGPKTERPFNF